MTESASDEVITVASDVPTTVELADEALDDVVGGASVGFSTGNLSRLNGS